MKRKLINNEMKEISDVIIALTIEKTYSNAEYYYKNCYSSPSNPWACEIGAEKVQDTQIVKVKYIIPQISSYILHYKKVDLTLTKQFYSLYVSYIFKENEWITYILHPLLPAIKYANDFNSLSLLAREGVYLGIKKFNLKELAILIKENPALKYDPPAYLRNEPGLKLLKYGNDKEYGSTVAQYIPSIEEFSSTINKFMLKTYLRYISNKKLSADMLDHIGEFIDSSQPLVDTTDIALLQSLIERKKLNTYKVLLSKECKIKEVYELLYKTPFCHDTSTITYLVPKVSSILLHGSAFSSRLLKKTIEFYPELISLSKSEISLIIHPLFVAINNRDLYLAVSILAQLHHLKNSNLLLMECSWYELREIKKFYMHDKFYQLNDKDMDRYSDFCEGFHNKHTPCYWSIGAYEMLTELDTNWRVYKDKVKIYIPSSTEFDYAVKEILSINKKINKFALRFLLNSKLPNSLYELIQGFLGEEEFIFDTTDLSVLKALIEKKKTNNHEIYLTKESTLTEQHVSGVKDLLKISRDLTKTKSLSLLESMQKGIIGSRYITGFLLKEVDDNGNCFYLAVADQMLLIDHNHISSVPDETEVVDSLRLAVQRENFLDREWSEDSTFDRFVTEFPDVILAIIDTRNPERGFTCYYIDEDGTVTTNNGSMDLKLPDRPIIRLAATGNHFLSVRIHPILSTGAITSEYHSYNQQEDLESNNESDKQKVGEVTEISLNPNVIVILNVEILYNNQFLNHKTLLDQAYKLAGTKAVNLLLELGANQEIAKQILHAANEFGSEKTLKTLLGMDKSIELQTTKIDDDTTLKAIEKIESIIGKEALIGIEGFYQYVSAALSNNQLSSSTNKVIKIIGNLVSNLEEWLDFGNIYENIDIDNQVSIILAQLEHWLDFVASGATYIGLPPRYSGFDPGDDHDGGSVGGSSNGGEDWRADDQNEYPMILLTGQNTTNITTFDFINVE